MSFSSVNVLNIYKSVMDEVIAGVRESFRDEGVDEQVLNELKHMWMNKLRLSKAVDPTIGPNSLDSMVSQWRNSKITSHPIHTKYPENFSDSQQRCSQSKQRPVSQVFPFKVSEVPHSGLRGTSSSAAGNAVASNDANKIVPIQITLPAPLGVANAERRILTIKVPESAVKEKMIQSLLTLPVLNSIMPLPTHAAALALQNHINAVLLKNKPTVEKPLKQFDGAIDTSDEEGSNSSDSDDNEDEDDDDEDDENIPGSPDVYEEPLNSGDDLTEEETADLFDTDNVIVCQYDKITRTKNRWRFILKDGIMNLDGKDYVFQKSSGEADW